MQATISHAHNNNLSEIESILELAHHEELIVQEWQLRMREGQGQIKGQDAFLQHVHNLNNQFTDWDVSDVHMSEAEWSVSATRSLNQDDSFERLSIYAYEQNGSYEIIHTYELNGTSTQALGERELHELLEERRTLFSLQDSPVYSQVTSVRAEDSEYVEPSLMEQARAMISTLGAKEIESLNEETFVSVSAYNDVWTDAIVTNGNKMNLQVALRSGDTMGTGTTVTIGTPIITTEY
ncbi:YwmB family TATA-box binding protein [Alkalihalophilus sp. As8PL]|uniref:YwmB family TATA-box binding protein n=1 Tax=Alkalihalophilus sp. As8PL TaxID=3237103 RepID=A0AB39BP93_9BACI